MNTRDLASGLFWFVVSILVCIEAVRLDTGTLNVPGPGFAVLLAGAVLGLFSILLIIGTLLRRKANIPTPETTSVTKGRGWMKVYFLIGRKLAAKVASLPTRPRLARREAS